LLLSYERLRDEVTKEIETARARIECGELTSEEMKSLLFRLLRERELMVAELDDLREARYGWISDAERRRDSMKLMLSELDEGAYNALESASSRLGVSVGRLLNEMMGKAVDKGGAGGEFPDLSSDDISHLLRRDGGAVKIQHLQELTINGADLADVGLRVKFSHIGNLEFDETVGEDQFWGKVKGISHCRNIKLPGNLSKLLVYAKSSHCDTFEFTQPEAAS
jgi:hypothetical protein